MEGWIFGGKIHSNKNHKTGKNNQKSLWMLYCIYWTELTSLSFCISTRHCVDVKGNQILKFRSHSGSGHRVWAAGTSSWYESSHIDGSLHDWLASSKLKSTINVCFKKLYDKQISNEVYELLYCNVSPIMYFFKVKRLNMHLGLEAWDT